MDKNKIGIWGLVINSLGVLISAVSFREDPNVYTPSLRSGIQYHPALVSSIGFKLGLFLIILGFVFQIYGKVMKEGEKEPTPTMILTYSFVAFIVYVLINFFSAFLFL